MKVKAWSKETCSQTASVSAKSAARLAGEADDDVRRQGEPRHLLAQLAPRRHEALARVRAPHRLEDARRARLQRQVHVLADRRALAVRGDDVVTHVLRVRAHVADALDAGHRVQQPQQLAEATALGTGRSRPGVDVLAGGVSSRTPSAAKRSASATSSAAGRDCSRPRTKGAMRSEHVEPSPARSAAGPGTGARGASAGRRRIRRRSEVPTQNVSPASMDSPRPRCSRAVGQVDERIELEQLVADDSDSSRRPRSPWRGRAAPQCARSSGASGSARRPSRGSCSVEDEHVGLRGVDHLTESRATPAAPSCARSRGRHLTAEHRGALAAHLVSSLGGRFDLRRPGLGAPITIAAITICAPTAWRA